jgi:hypothetical protein
VEPGGGREGVPAYWYTCSSARAERVPWQGHRRQRHSATIQTQAQFVDQLKQGCQLCHQLGNQITRSVDHMKALNFKTALEAWDHRVKTGQRGGEMDGMMRRLGPRALRMYAEWTDRIAAGALPPAPPRPAGAERNLVVTMWDWGNSTSYMHDEITTSKQNPRVNVAGRCGRSMPRTLRVMPIRSRTRRRSPRSRRATTRRRCARASADDAETVQFLG